MIRKRPKSWLINVGMSTVNNPLTEGRKQNALRRKKEKEKAQKRAQKKIRGS